MKAVVLWEVDREVGGSMGGIGAGVGGVDRLEELTLEPRVQLY
jgi:hypothetical protein